jgi:hypothetical protein
MAKENRSKKNRDAALQYLATGEAAAATEVIEDDGADIDQTIEEIAGEVEETVEEPVAEDEAEQEAEPEVPAEKPKKGAKPVKEVVEEAEEAPAEEDVDGNVADVDPNALPEEYLENPRVQELVKAEEYVNILKDSLANGYAIDFEKDPMEALRMVNEQRKDAALLYGMLDGQTPASTLLAAVEKNPQFANMVEPIFTSLIEHLGAKGFADWYLDKKGFKIVPKDVVTPAAKPKAVWGTTEETDPKLKPLLDKITQLESKLGGGGAAGANGMTPEETQHEANFEGEIKRLMKDKGVPEDKFFGEYKSAIVQMIRTYPGGQKAIMDRIAKGNYVDVKRFFANHNNAMIARADAYKKGSTASVPKKTVTPAKSATNSGKTAAPVAKKKAPLSDEQAKKARLDAGLKALNEQ